MGALICTIKRGGVYGPSNERAQTHQCVIQPGGCAVISSVFVWWTSLGASLVTGSLLFAAPVRSGTVLCLPRGSTDFLQWTVDSISRITSGAWLMNGMATLTGLHKADGAGGSSGPGACPLEFPAGGRDTRLGGTS